ncbi:hypothetical protein EDD21DRAFT_417191 [Dissophora ornata]|nr:hypothetical protein EDD21DRAFT_417191 [Dissophora ornata]
MTISPVILTNPVIRETDRPVDDHEGNLNNEAEAGADDRASESRRQDQTIRPRMGDYFSIGDMDALDNGASELISKGSVELVTSPRFTSRLFCIPKKKGELRPILNLQPPNRFVTHQFQWRGKRYQPEYSLSAFRQLCWSPRRPSKSHLGPFQLSQQLDRLGFTINARTMALSVLGAKIRVVRRRDANRMLALGHQWNDLVSITQEAAEDLLWWRTNRRSWNVCTWTPRQTELDVYTDASDDSWGIAIDGRTWEAIWPLEERDLHISHTELLTVLFAIRLRQHNDNSQCQPFWRSQVPDEDSDTIMEPLSTNRDQDRNDCDAIKVLR